MTQRRHLTEKMFYHYIKCPHWVYFDAHAQEERVHHPLLSRLVTEGLIEEKTREMLADRPDVAEVTAQDVQEAFYETLAFMREGRQTIYRGVLVDAHWVAHPDVLERVEGTSRFGSYYYVAADMKQGIKVRKEHQFQGCFYADLLQRLQGTKPVQGYVITPDKHTHAYVISACESEYRVTLDHIERILEGEEPEHFTSSACKQSPWFDVCREYAQSCGDITLINRLKEEERAVFLKHGLKTVQSVAQTPLETLLQWFPQLQPKRLDAIHDQATALWNGTHRIRSAVVFPESQTAYYLDVESDPLRDFDYLFGVLAVKKGRAKFQPFFTDKPEKESQIWEEFLACVNENPASPIYHYGAFEKQVVHRFATRFGMEPQAMALLEGRLVDVLETLRPAVAFPLTFYSLKDIGSYIGYTWKSADASGANSVLWFEEYLETKKRALLKKILDYNEDDVRATYAVKEWLQQQGGV